MTEQLQERLAMAERFIEDEVYQALTSDSDLDQKFAQNMKAILLLLSDLQKSNARYEKALTNITTARGHSDKVACLAIIESCAKEAKEALI